MPQVPPPPAPAPQIRPPPGPGGQRQASVQAPLTVQAEAGKKRVRRARHAIVAGDRGQEGREWSCSQCERKGIACTEHKKPKERGGKLIAQAKNLFGSNTHPKPTPDPDHLTEGEIQDGESLATPFASGSRSAGRDKTLRIGSVADERSGGIGEIDEEVGKELIQSYFLYTHPQIPILEADQFINYSEGTLGDLGHIDECLLSVIQAFGARVSSHPSLLPAPPHTSPSNATPSPPTIPSLLAQHSKDFIPYGKHRAPFAAAMLSRAFETADRMGVWRRRSVDNVRSLVLLECLVNWGNPTHSNGHPMIAAAVEHMRELKYYAQYPLARERDAAVGGSATASPTSLGDVGVKEAEEKELKNIEGGLIWWFVYIRDALNACLSRRLPHITKEDVEILSPVSLNPRFESVMAELNSDDGGMVARAASIGLFSHWTNVARELARNCLVHLPTRSRTDEDMALRKFWQGTDESDMLISTFDARKKTVLGSLADKFEGTIRVLTVSRAKVIEAAHRWVGERHADVVDALGGFDMLGGEKRREWEVWESFRRESGRRVLKASRDVARIVEKNLSTTLFMGGGLSFDLLYSTAEILLDAPATNDPRPNSWNQETKVREVQLCIDALKQLGWAWDTEDCVNELSERLATQVREHNLNANLDPSVFSAPSISYPPAPSNTALTFDENLRVSDSLAEMLSGFMPTSSSFDIEDMLSAVGNIPAQDHTRADDSADIRHVQDQNELSNRLSALNSGLRMDIDDLKSHQLTPVSSSYPTSTGDNLASPFSKADQFNNPDGLLFMS
ncbi:hypothetical protein BT69DRAFT_1325927 [Atractiella rhizophila]|nr:hypothetical protein BT69DRAFT_1325927 [Atractiella rhizophila]